MKQITQVRLKELVRYDKDTGIFIWKEHRQCVKKGAVAGSTHDGYVRMKVDGWKCMAHRLAWLYVYGYIPENSLDHIDRVKNHNWISNLREVSSSCNLRNSKLRKDNTSGIRGVTPTNNNKWDARIMVLGNAITLGRHKDFAEAVCHRLAAEQFEEWEGCNSSTSAYQYVKKNIKPIRTQQK